MPPFSFGILLLVIAALAGASGSTGAQERRDPTMEAIKAAPYLLRLRTVSSTVEPGSGPVSTCQLATEVIFVVRAPLQANLVQGGRLAISVLCRPDKMRYGGAIAMSSVGPGQTFDAALVTLSTGELRMIPRSFRNVQQVQ